MSHVRFNSHISQNAAQEKAMEARIEKFSESVTAILRDQAAMKGKKLMYVFVDVNQLTHTSFQCVIDDSRDKITDAARKGIMQKFDELFVLSK